MNKPKKALGDQTGSAEASSCEPTPDGAAYEPPRLEVLGTVAEITSGVVGKSDGLGPGSVVGP